MEYGGIEVEFNSGEDAARFDTQWRQAIALESIAASLTIITKDITERRERVVLAKESPTVAELKRQHQHLLEVAIDAQVAATDFANEHPVVLANLR